MQVQDVVPNIMIAFGCVCDSGGYVFSTNFFFCFSIWLTNFFSTSVAIFHSQTLKMFSATEFKPRTLGPSCTSYRHLFISTAESNITNGGGLQGLHARSKDVSRHSWGDIAKHHIFFKRKNEKEEEEEDNHTQNRPWWTSPVAPWSNWTSPKRATLSLCPAKVPVFNTTA